jgi:hypothetical protein
MRFYRAFSVDGASFAQTPGALASGAVLLPNGKYRMYFGNSPAPGVEYDLKSALSP